MIKNKQLIVIKNRQSFQNKKIKQKEDEYDRKEYIRTKQINS